MRIRALITIVLTAGWMLPAGALACPSLTADADSHSHADHGTGHEHGNSDPGHGDHDPGADSTNSHDHVAGPGAQRAVPGAPDAPLDEPKCCSDDTRAPAVVASALDAKPRPRSISFALASPLLGAPGPVVLPARARLRLRQPAPLPYARTHRPLLI